MIFEILLHLFLFGSLLIYVPARIDGDELYVLFALMALTALSWAVRPLRQVRIGFLAFLFLFAELVMILKFRIPLKMNVFNLFIGISAIKIIAERISLDMSRIGKLLILFFILTYGMIALQYAGLDKWYFPGFEEYAGFSFRPWILACTAALSVPFVYAVNPWALLIVIPAFWFGHSSVCVLAGLIAFAILRGIKLRTFLIIALPLIAVYLFGENGIEPHRFQVWKNSLQYFKDYWLGHGVGTWAHMGFVHMNGADAYHWRWAHNEFYQFIFEFGIPALFFLAVWISTLLIGQSILIKSAVTSLLIISLFHPVFHWGKTSFLIIVILALAEAAKGEKWPNQMSK